VVRVGRVHSLYGERPRIALSGRPADSCQQRSLAEGAPRRLNTRRRCGGLSVTSSDSADCGRIASPAGAVRRTVTNKTYPNDMEFTCEAVVRNKRLGMKSANRGVLDIDGNTCPLFSTEVDSSAD